MTINEAGILVAKVTATYPGYYRNFSPEMVTELINAWAYVLDDVSYDRACKGLKHYMKNDRNGFPPSPGQVIAYIPSEYEDMLKEVMALADNNQKRLKG